MEKCSDIKRKEVIITQERIDNTRLTHFNLKKKNRNLHVRYAVFRLVHHIIIDYSKFTDVHKVFKNLIKYNKPSI